MSDERDLAGDVTAGALVLAIVAPLWFVLVGSVTPTARLFEGPPLWPAEPVLEHYRALFLERAFARPVLNSLVVALAATAVCVTLGSLAAWAIARLEFRGKGPLLALFLAASMLPQIAVVSPLYLLLRRVGLIDTLPGLVLPYVAFSLPLAVWLLTGVMKKIPRELEEAALVDGASRARAFVTVVLPLAAPGIASSAILTFVASWNEFLLALSFTVGPERHTLPVATAFLSGRFEVPWGQILAATVVASAPVALLVLIFQRWITGGLTAGAVKQ